MMLSLVPAVWAQAPPPEVAVCIGCHGQKGTSPSAQWPHLAGQPPAYVEKQLWDYRAGIRTDPTMTGLTASLDAAAIQAAAAWFGAAPAGFSLPSGPATARGERIYQGGDPSRGLAPCRACHGPTGAGGQDARGNAFPALAGQHQEYLVRQLQAFANGTRRNDPGGMMSLIAGRLGRADVEAVAAYLSTAVEAP